jgi:DNA-binding MurR/RpiR family transcriptional regulator
MEQFQSLRSRITDLVDTLSPKQKRIAKFVLEDAYFTSFASANELGKKNNTTAATVVRFAQTLGYEGYSQLQDELRSELPNHLTTTARMQKHMNAGTPKNTNFQQVFLTDIKNIEQTANSISEEKLNEALDAVIKAKRIWVIGAGLSFPAASLLIHSLKVMGFDAVGFQGDVVQSAVDILRIKPDDLMIAISLWRYLRTTVDAVSQAKEIGTPVIAITDSIVSPLAKKADIAFEIETIGVAHSLSITAIISLVNVFITMLADRVPEQVYESLKRVDDAYRSNDLVAI